MKRKIYKYSESEILKDFPIKSELAHWYLRVNETSNNVWEVEGSDLWGRKVHCHGTNPDELIAEATEMAKQVESQVNLQRNLSMKR